MFALQGIFICIITIKIFPSTQSDLIYTGMDTLFTGGYYSGMDFVAQRPCSSGVDEGCKSQCKTHLSERDQTGR